jgi:hypothetical protein
MAKPPFRYLVTDRVSKWRLFLFPHSFSEPSHMDVQDGIAPTPDMPRTGQAAQADQTETLIVPADDGREHLVVIGNGMAGCRAVEELWRATRAAIA